VVDTFPLHSFTMFTFGETAYHRPYPSVYYQKYEMKDLTYFPVMKRSWNSFGIMISINTEVVHDGHIL